MLHFILPIAESLAALGLLTKRDVRVLVESRECFRNFGKTIWLQEHFVLLPITVALVPAPRESGGSPGARREGKVETMRKTAFVLATAATLGFTAVAAPAPAEARGGFGPGLAGGLIAGALIGGIASSAYAYGPGYGYYGGYAPAYYDDYAYAPAYSGYGYAPAYYGGYASTYYAPAYYGYRYRRAVRPAYAYYGGPVYRGWRHHHRWHRHW
jgi:hypothetical protein